MSRLADLWSVLRSVRVPVREVLLAAVLVVAGLLVVQGIAMINVPAAYIVGGLLVAVIGCLFLIEASD